MNRRRWLLCLLCVLCLLPAFSQESPRVRFAVIGDSGTGDEHQHRIARQMAAWHDRLPFSLVLMLGDNIYGSLWRGGRQEEFARKFDRPYAELLRRGVVFRAALGNHDMYTREGRDLIQARDRFHIDGAEGYYNFTAGATLAGAPLVELFVLNSVRLEKDKQDAAQLAWLEQALEASRARWRIAYFHHPLYSTGEHHGADAKLRAKLEPFFLGAASLRHGFSRAESGVFQARALAPEGPGSDQGRPRIHVVFSGHDHIYQRFHPQQGIVYFIVGSSGKLRRGNARPSPQVAAVNDRTHSFLLVEATPERVAFWAIDERGQAFDCGVIQATGTLETAACSASPSAQ